MQAADRSTFLQHLEALAATFRAEASEALLEGYWFALEDLPLAAITNAVKSAIRNCERMPSGSELRKLTGEMTTSTRAVHAWAAVEKAIGQHGYYASVDFDDPLINATVRNLGGWMRLCQLDAEEFSKWVRKDFERIYQALCVSGVSGEQIKYLPGRHETDNTAKGYEIKAPARIATGLPPHREGVILALPAPQNSEGNVKQLVGHVVDAIAKRSA